MPRYPFSVVVECLNCGMVWERITEMSGGDTGPLLSDLQKNCPGCGSNAFKPNEEKDFPEVEKQ